MEFYKRLQKHALKSRMPWIILLAALAFLFGLASFNSASHANGEMADLMDYSGSQLQKFEWYQLDTNLVFGEFATDNKGAYYVVRLEQDNTFLAVYVSKSDTAKIDQVVEQTWAYLSETADAPTARLTGRGKLLSLESKEAMYFHEFFTDLGLSLSEVNYVDYKLDLYSGGTEGVGAVLFGLAAAAALIILLIVLIRFGRKKYRKNVDQTIQERGLNPDMIGEDLNSGLQTKMADFGSHYAVLYSPQQLVDYQDLVWVYKQKNTTQHRLYGIIPVGKTVVHSLVLTTRDKKQLNTTVKKEAEADEVLQYMITKAPFVLYGYTEELAGIYKQNFETMVAAVDQRKATNV